MKNLTLLSAVFVMTCASSALSSEPNVTCRREGSTLAITNNGNQPIDVSVRYVDLVGADLTHLAQPQLDSLGWIKRASRAAYLTAYHKFTAITGIPLPLPAGYVGADLSGEREEVDLIGADLTQQSK